MKVTDVPGITKIDFWYQDWSDVAQGLTGAEVRAWVWRYKSPVVYNCLTETTHVFVKLTLARPARARVLVVDLPKDALQKVDIIEKGLADRLWRCSLEFRWATSATEGLVLDIRSPGIRRNLANYLRYVIREIKKA